VVALSGLIALPEFMKLSRGAGAALSGHVAR
jgi:hypothetical protein